MFRGRIFGEALSLALVARLMSIFSHNDKKIIEYSSKGLPLWRLRQITEYIEDRLAHDISIADLAKIAMMSEFHFTRMFKQSAGVTPYQFVMTRRIFKARDLLARSNLPLHEIAASTGFSDQAHFSTVFKKIVGSTPGKFRNTVR